MPLIQGVQGTPQPILATPGQASRIVLQIMLPVTQTAGPAGKWGQMKMEMAGYVPQSTVIGN